MDMTCYDDLLLQLIMYMQQIERLSLENGTLEEEKNSKLSLRECVSITMSPLCVCRSSAGGGKCEGVNE